jgi:hypothetical protein
MKHLVSALALAIMSSGLAGSAGAVTVLTFEGLQDLEPVGSFYNGGTGGNGSGPGPNLGAAFSSNALAVIDADAGGTGNIGGEPSPSTALFFLSGTAATLNYSAGFSTGFSFFYTAINNPGSIAVYDGLDATGNVLATLELPLTPFNGAPDPNGAFSPFVPIGVGFNGIAKSIDFGGTINQIAFDDITFGSTTPGAPSPVPEPGTLLLFGTAMAGLGAVNRWRARRKS